MAIRSLEVLRCPPRWLFLRLETEDGLIGWGEAIGDHHDAVEAALQALAADVVGADETRIEHLRRLTHVGGFWRDGPIRNTAVSALDMALWDLAGQRLGAPVHDLLGGRVRDRIRVYRNVWGTDPDSFAASARTAVTDEQLDLVKVSPAGPTAPVASDADLDQLVATAAAVREAIGLAADLTIDLHGRLTPAVSRRVLPRLAILDPLFVEEPCLPGPPATLRDLSSVGVPLATGERLLRQQDFFDLLHPSPAVAVIQPDLSLCGGLREGLALAQLAEATQVAFAPHCPYGPVQTAASLQLAATAPAHLAQEVQSLGGAGLPSGCMGGGWGWSFNAITTPWTVHDGRVTLPSTPGLGIEVDEEAIAEHQDEWRPGPPPRWQLADGTQAEW